MAEKTCTDRMSIPFAGDIRQMIIPWLFQALRTQSRTGTAVFEYIQDRTAEKAVKKVYFKHGDATFASSSLQDDWLGRWLVRAGTITEQQCAASEELVQKTGKKQGAILVELGFLSPQKLVEGLKHQVKQIILSLFSLGMGFLPVRRRSASPGGNHPPPDEHRQPDHRGRHGPGVEGHPQGPPRAHAIVRPTRIPHACSRTPS